MIYVTRRSLCLLLIILALAVEDSHAQSFMLTGNMTTPRMGHTATLLQDGRVLIAGGYDYTYTGSGASSPHYTATAEIYDPVTGSFVETGKMAADRAYHTAVLLQDGRVLVAGGCFGPGRCIESAELYDPSNGTFTNVGNMSVTHAASAVLLKNGKALLSGYSAAELFDPATGRFTPLPNVRGEVVALLSDGEVLLSTLPEFSLYDPAKDEFRQLPISWNVFGTTATPLLDGSIFLAGGFTGIAGNDTSPLTSLYHPATQILETAADLPSPRSSHTATLLKDGRVLIAGGYKEQGHDVETFFANGELYDPTTGMFSRTGDTLMYRSGHVATLLRDGRVLITGGWPINSEYRTAELFIPESTQGVVPRLELNSTRYCAGDPWTLRAESMAPLTSVQIIGTQDGIPWTIMNWQTSGEDGRLVASGTYDAAAVGRYDVWLYAGGKTSNTVSVTVENCSVHLDLVNSKSPDLQTDFHVGDSWTLHVMSAMPSANVKLLGISNGTPWTIEAWGRTASDGSFTATGTFLPGSDGLHDLRVIVGSAQSNQVRFRVVDY